MAFNKKTWTDRVAEFINRRSITHEDGSEELVTVARSEGTVSQEGDAFNAATMNDLEERIEDEFESINSNLASMFATEIIELQGTAIAPGKYGYINFNFEVPDGYRLFTMRVQSNMPINATIMSNLTTPYSVCYSNPTDISRTPNFVVVVIFIKI